MRVGEGVNMRFWRHDTQAIGFSDPYGRVGTLSLGGD